MSLDLVLGPAGAGKLDLLLDRYLAHLDGGGDALLVVPTSAAVRRVEARLLERRGVLLGGGIVAFDRVFARVLRNAGTGRRVLSRVERRVLLGRLVADGPLGPLRASARGVRFVDALGRLFDRLGGALVDPARLRGAGATAGDDEAEADGGLADLYEAWWALLDEVGAWDAARMRLQACRTLRSSLAAWERTRLFVQGFEDFTRAQEALVLGVAQRAGVTLTLPYEPARPAFAALRGTVERLAEGARIDELPARDDGRPAALVALERRLFEYAPDEPAPTPAARDDAVTLVEAAGPRAEAELVAGLVARTLRDGVPAERVAVVVPRDPAAQADLLDVLAQAGVPLHVDAPVDLPSTPLGRALDRLLSVAWAPDFTREELFEYLRSPWSGVRRRQVDFIEGRLRARGVSSGPEAYATACELLGRSPGLVERLRLRTDLAAAAGDAVRTLVAVAQGLHAPDLGPALVDDLAAARAALGTLEALSRGGLGASLSVEELRLALHDTRVAPERAAAGRVLVRDLRGARGLDVDVVVVLGLEEGGLGRPPVDDALLSERRRERLGRDLDPVDPGDLDRHRLYTALTRARRHVVLVRRFAAEDGRPLEASPLLEEVARALGGLRAVERRRLSDVTTPIEQAPSARERLRALCRLAVSDPDRARRLAESEGAGRRLRRAEEAFSRRTALRDPLVLEQLRALDRFSATSLEKFADCSSWWFVERFLEPKEIDGALDARVAGQIAHVALQRFYKALPAEFGKDRLEPADAERAAALMRSLVAESMAGSTVPVDTLEGRLLERRLARDLAAFVRREAETASPLAATRLEVAFGGASSAPGLKDGLRIEDFHVAGKIDRIDTDPLFSARGLVQDYKSGRAFTAREIADESRLQIPLYMLATRELLGIEPMGGLYRSIGPAGATRGMLDAGQGDALPGGVVRNDLLDSDEFWGRVEEARRTAVRIVGRMRRGDIRHDPQSGRCPSYCPWGGVCRVSSR